MESSDLIDPHESDPAMVPVEEAGGGVAEGFEQAERDLIDHASHAEPGGNPEADAFTPEEESDRSTAEYGEADEVGSSEIRPEDADPS